MVLLMSECPFAPMTCSVPEGIGTFWLRPKVGQDDTRRVEGQLGDAAHVTSFHLTHSLVMKRLLLWFAVSLRFVHKFKGWRKPRNLA